MENLDVHASLSIQISKILNKLYDLLELRICLSSMPCDMLTPFPQPY